MSRVLTAGEIEHQISEFNRWIERGCRRRNTAEAAAYQAERALIMPKEPGPG